MKNKLITLILIIGLATTSIGWALSHSKANDLTEIVNEQKVDLNKKSTEIANLEIVVVEKDDNLKSRDMVIEEQDIQINKRNKKIENLEAKLRDYKSNFKAEKESSDAKVYTNISRQKSDVLYTLTVNASAYIALCDTGCTGITTSGEDVKDSIYFNGMGIIATDTSVIPMFSIVEIEGFNGRFIALDTGGAIKGNKIDILVGSTQDAIDFGRKNLEVKVIRKGGKR